MIETAHPAPRPASRLVPLQAAVAMVFTVLTVLIAGGLVLFNHTQLTKLAEREARRNFDAVNHLIRADRASTSKTSEMLLETMGLALDPDLPPEELHPLLLNLMRQVDRSLPATFGIFIGRPDGSLIEAQDLTGPRADAVTRIAGDKGVLGLNIIERAGAGATQYWIVYDAAGREVGRTPKVATDFDARKRTWYQQAQASRQTILTPPYAFANVKTVGITLARAAPSRPGVVFGLDITLEGLDAVLAEGRHRLPWIIPAVFDIGGHLVAHPDGEELRRRAKLDDGALLPKLSDVGSPLLAAMGRSFAETGLNKDARFDFDGQTYFARFGTAGPEDSDFVVALAVPEAVMMGEANRIRAILLAGSAAALIPSLLLIFLAARRLVAPLKLATHDLDHIVALRFGGVRPVRSNITEVEDLGRAIRTLEHVLQTFVRYVPFSLVRGVVDRSFSTALGGRRQPICVMFSDIEAFTRLAETLDPDDLMHQTSRYFGELGDELVRAEATIDKYIGDAVMAFWNAPDPQEDYVRLACIGVLRAARRIDRLNAAFVAEGAPTMVTRFGLHAGEAVVGNVGTVDRMNYTALGHTVNLASRLEGLNRQFGTTILVSEAVVAAAGEGFVFRPVGETVPRGATRPMTLYELVGADIEGEPDLAPPRTDQPCEPSLPGPT
ncbi:adenylate/guanylate cyclase domain-containing protein [Enterovirga rhinocerotis]|nr:adenylate/guanylate cyclase domain-containing protein [Enterovirga rhinocerotis]